MHLSFVPCCTFKFYIVLHIKILHTVVYSTNLVFTMVLDYIQVQKATMEKNSPH